MTDLVACLGTGKGTWTGVMKLLAKPDFDNVFLIVNAWTKQNLRLTRQNVHLITVNSDDKTILIRDAIISQMHGKVKDFEVAVNLDSGTGKEHTAVLTALMRLGLGFRFVVCDEDKIEEISYSMQVEPPEEY